MAATRSHRRSPGAAEVTFRRLADDDLPMLHRWLNEPGVVRGWEGDDVFGRRSCATTARPTPRPGSAMTAAFVADVVFALHPGWTQAGAAPFEANLASWRALERRPGSDRPAPPSTPRGQGA